MNTQRLLERFERIAEAPDAVPRLRRFILDLAVRGKLVEQDPREEPVAELLKRIRVEKARLIKEGKIRKSSPLATVSANDAPFPLPVNWQWTRFGELIEDADSGWSPKTEGFPRSGENWGVLKVSAVSWGRFLPEENKQLLPNVVPPKSAAVHSGDFLISRANTSELVAKCVVVEDEPKMLILSDKIVRLQLAGECAKRFLCIANNSAEYARAYYAEQASGTSLSMKNVSRPVIYALAIPVPPLAEQHRIVAKVDELMALCDRLEAAQAERESRRDRLVAASLHRLNIGSDAESFREHARFHLRHLPRLTTHPEHIQQFRQTILNLAVRGQLVPQDPNDEPAVELMDRVYIGRNVRRKFASLNLEEMDSSLPVIPSNWKWAVVDQMAADDDNAITDGPFGANLKTEHYVAKPGYRVIRLQNIGHREFRGEHLSFVDAERFNRLSKHHVYPGDLVVAGLVDPTVRCCALPADIGRALVKADCYRFAVHPEFSSRFALHYLNSGVCQNFAAAHHHGMTLTRIGLGNFRCIPFPLPPIAEQHRIVAKVDELMALCDQVETRLITTAVTRRQLIEATLRQIRA